MVLNSKENCISLCFGVVYVFNDDINFYLSYLEGFLLLSGIDVEGKLFGFEENDLFEVGVKFSYVNISGMFVYFDVSKSNMLVVDLVNVGYLIFVGKVNSIGFELDLIGLLGDNIEYNLFYVYVDVEIVIDSLNVDWLVLIFKGSLFVNVLKNNFLIGLNYDLNLFV